MAKRTSFLIRIDPRLLDELKRWADAEFRSTNAQIEFLLRKSLADAGRLGRKESTKSTEADIPANADSPSQDSDRGDECPPGKATPDHESSN